MPNIKALVILDFYKKSVLLDTYMENQSPRGGGGLMLTLGLLFEHNC
jgi:hypothetical protein